jgi:hypothetical protein
MGKGIGRLSGADLRRTKPGLRLRRWRPVAADHRRQRRWHEQVVDIPLHPGRPHPVDGAGFAYHCRPEGRP